MFKYIIMNTTVIINVYKRWYSLEEQVKAYENQSVKPREIIIFQNEDSLYDIPKWILEKHKVIRSNFNWWVRFRFTVWLNVITEYINIVDDDTIPWIRWLENCEKCMSKVEWLYWTVWHIYKDRVKRSPQMARPWRTQPNTKTVYADIIWHSWFLKRDWLKYFFSETIPCNTRPYNWEDIWLSYQLQKQWIPTLIAPHPCYDRQMRGSLKWNEYWWDKNANCIWKGREYQDARKYILDKWFKILVENEEFRKINKI